MARILLSSPMDRPWSVGHALTPALQRTGHTVHAFNCRGAANAGEELLRVVEVFQPEVHVLCSCACYPPDVIDRIRAQGVYHVLWYPDVTPTPRPEAVELARHYDVFFTMAQGLVEPFREAGVENAEWLPEAMEPSVFEYDGISDTDRRTFTCDVALVGKLESDNPAYMERWKLVKRIVDEEIDIKWWGPRINRKIGTFVLGLLLSKVSRAYGGRFVWNETYAKAVHLSKIFLARDAYPHIRLSMSARAFIALGLGAFYLTFPTDGIEEMFEPGVEIVTFDSPDDMIEKIRYYIEHDGERNAIAAAGKKRALAEHTYQNRFERMFEVIAERGCALGSP